MFVTGSPLLGIRDNSKMLTFLYLCPLQLLARAGGLIVYLYGPLYRLTSATYSTGNVFSYTYDATGNRLTQATITNTPAYTCDDANRLTNLGVVAIPGTPTATCSATA
jgi:YD repeat-containing protein